MMKILQKIGLKGLVFLVLLSSPVIAMGGGDEEGFSSINKNFMVHLTDEKDDSKEKNFYLGRESRSSVTNIVGRQPDGLMKIEDQSSTVILTVKSTSGIEDKKMCKGIYRVIQKPMSCCSDCVWQSISLIMAGLRQVSTASHPHALNFPVAAYGAVWSRFQQR